MTEKEIERAERLIQALDRVGDLLTKVAENMERPSPGWRRMLDEFKGAVSRMPTTLRARF